ncbi:hypothetical protein A1356_22675 [Methylomonas koyamae]|uniref:Type I restriction modification DNA specificity domain-containing protein n=2 Tax=Methylomonas koyamae TaxID=702114 RepID=A0AA91DG24_9GAMM|nr:hypothetical protein A1356_22675 [Methylomonas koyamae]
MYLIKNGDILIGMDGDFEVHRWGGENALLNQRVCKVEAATPEIDSGFLYWYLKPEIAAIHQRTPQTTVRHLSTKDLYVIPMPSIGSDEQAVAGQILDTIDTAIHETEAIIAKLKAVKQGLLHDLLTRGIDANGELRPPQTEAPHLYKPSPLGWIPKEWKMPQLYEVCTTIGDGVHYAVRRSAEGVPFLFVSCIRNGEIDWNASSYVSPDTYREIKIKGRPQKGLILFTVVGSYGHAAQIDEEINFGFERNIAFVMPSASVIQPRYLFYFLSSLVTKNQVEKLVIGNAQKVLTLGALKGVLTLLPTFEEQIKISAALDVMSTRIANEIGYVKKMRVQKIALMDDLLTGRVRVTPLLEGDTP